MESTSDKSAVDQVKSGMIVGRETEEGEVTRRPLERDRAGYRGYDAGGWTRPGMPSLHALVTFDKISFVPNFDLFFFLNPRSSHQFHRSQPLVVRPLARLVLNYIIWNRTHYNHCFIAPLPLYIVYMQTEATIDKIRGQIKSSVEPPSWGEYPIGIQPRKHLQFVSLSSGQNPRCCLVMFGL